MGDDNSILFPNIHDSHNRNFSQSHNRMGSLHRKTYHNRHFAIASFSLDVEDLQLIADITATDKVTCVLSNNTGSAVNLGEGTIRVKVIKQ